MKHFNREEQRSFWAGDKSYSKGDVISKTILSLAKRYIGSNAVDVGAGSGALMNAFREKHKQGKQIIGVDLTPKNEDIEFGDCTQLPFKDKDFDTCFCTDVIEHLSDSDLPKCVSEINRVLKTGGYGIFSTIDNEVLANSTVTCPECGCEFHTRGHCQVFNRDRISTLFGQHGFEVVYTKTLKLHFMAKFPFLSRLFYLCHLNKFWNVNFMSADLFFVVRKTRDSNGD